MVRISIVSHHGNPLMILSLQAVPNWACLRITSAAHSPPDGADHSVMTLFKFPEAVAISSSGSPLHFQKKSLQLRTDLMGQGKNRVLSPHANAVPPGSNCWNKEPQFPKSASLYIERGSLTAALGEKSTFYITEPAALAAADIIRYSSINRPLNS